MAEVEDLRGIVHQHSLFFDRLVDMIPAKYYVPNEVHQDTWTFRQSKAAREARKKQTKENLKLAKRQRLDPDKFVSTSQLVQQQGTDEGAEEQPPPFMKNAQDPSTRAVTREQLVERLHKRIELLRAKRHADEVAATAKKSQTWQAEKKKESKKRKPVAAASANGVQNESEAPSKRSKSAAENISSVSGSEQVQPAGQPLNFEFGRVKMGLDAPGVVTQKKRPKPSKEELLAKATALQKEIQDPSMGQDVALKHSWSAAASRAAGEKVLDDPKLLKRSLKKDKQLKDKSARKWQERKDAEKRNFNEKQQKRREHISQRIDAKKERSIAKREKKLLRPGFEGRKEDLWSNEGTGCSLQGLMSASVLLQVSSLEKCTSGMLQRPCSCIAEGGKEEEVSTAFISDFDAQGRSRVLHSLSRFRSVSCDRKNHCRYSLCSLLNSDKLLYSRSGKLLNSR